MENLKPAPSAASSSSTIKPTPEWPGCTIPAPACGSACASSRKPKPCKGWAGPFKRLHQRLILPVDAQPRPCPSACRTSSPLAGPAASPHLARARKACPLPDSSCRNHRISAAFRSGLACHSSARGRTFECQTACSDSPQPHIAGCAAHFALNGG